MRDSSSEERSDEREHEANGVPASERLPRLKLSELLWNVDWNRHFPITLTEDGIAAHVSDYDTALPFIRHHYRAIFHEDGSSRFSTTRINVHKARYYRLAGDFFELRQGERTIGLVLGNPVDWSTYYIRSAAILPEFQCRQLVKGVLRFLLVHLSAAGVERVDADTSPSNLRVVHLLTSLDFNVSGSVLSDRWGAQVRLTRFLDERAEGVFLQQFCTGVSYQLRDRVQRAAMNSGPERR